MSISNAFSNAASGLAANARAVQVVSANIANALTPGYAPRSLDLAASTLGGTGGGVRMLGIARSVDAGLLGLGRDSAAAGERESTISAFWQSLEQALGLPGEGLSAALSAFDSALIAAAERPDLDSRLGAAVSAATNLVQQIANTQQAIQTRRTTADSAIARDISALNAGLVQLDALNDQIVRQRAGGQATLGLEDTRQALVSSLSEIVPLREQVRADGRTILFTASGALLLDLDPAEIGFTRALDIDPSLTIGAGLSGLSVRGQSVETGPGGPFSGGRLAANFQIRDTDALQMQADLDAFGADLIARFSDPATDPTLAPGLPGLFTDAGVLAAPIPGLAGRLAVHSAVLPESGGAFWRLRDGLGAPAPGPVGDPTMLNALSAALDRRLSAAPGSPARTLAQSLGEGLTRVSTARQGAEDAAANAQGRRSELSEQMLAQGVDSDAEMQRLLLIEQAYAANARVIETADAMLRRLLEI